MKALREELFGKEVKSLKVVEFAKNVAVTKGSVLIIGEAGVGKRTCASFIHNLSNRCDKDILFVDCAHDAQQVENEILGYHDPETQRFIKGALERGNGGTVVFVNVDSLDESFQKKLLQNI